MAIFWNVSISNCINLFDVSNKLPDFCVGYSQLNTRSSIDKLKYLQLLLTLCFFLMPYVPFVGVAEYSRSCSLCMITTDNWLTSRLAINFLRWSTADDTSLALLVPGDAVNPNTCNNLFCKWNHLKQNVICCFIGKANYWTDCQDNSK